MKTWGVAYCEKCKKTVTMEEHRGRKTNGILQCAVCYNSEYLKNPVLLAQPIED